MNKKITWGIVVVVVVILIAVGISKNSPKGSTEPIKIGGAFMLTGPTAHLGELQKNAVTLAVEKINNDGGINGRRLEIVIEDSAYDPKTAISAYQSLKTKGIRNFIIDGSSVVAATRRLVVDDGNFTISAIATAPSYFDGSNHTCRIALTAKTLGPAVSDLSLKNGYKNIAVFMPDNEYGRGFADEFARSHKDKGGTVVLQEFYDASPSANDFRTSITKIKAVQANIDAIVISQIQNNIEPMLKQMKLLSLSKPLVSEFPTMTNPVLKDMSLVEGAEYVEAEYTKEISPTDLPEGKSFKENYRARYGTDPILFAASHYDVVMILAKAIGEVGENPQKIADYVSSLRNYQGITGKLSFNSDCEVERNITYKKIVGGKIVDIK
jgi:branched-chain amino acid transport system substrate-binding protein